AQYRGEIAFFTSLVDGPNDIPGKNATALVTNVFGSKVLNDNWGPAKQTAMKYHTAYDCATAMIDDGPSATSTIVGPHFAQAASECGVGPTGFPNLPPLVPDPNDPGPSPRLVTKVNEIGEPVLAPYRGAFRGQETMWNMSRPVGQIKPTLI